MNQLLAKLVARQTLSVEETVDAFEQIMSGQAEPVQVGALLTAIAMRGATVDEITGAATVMREKVTPVTVPDGLDVIDTCGTGGDHGGTFNISTAAALVAAAVCRPRGVAVAKHGNRSVTSRSGSSTVLETLGVNIEVAPPKLTQCLDEVGLCFCYARSHHPAMKHAAPIRAALGFRTLFNILGPLTNPAGAKRQVMGVFDPALTGPIARVLQKLGGEHVMVVHGSGLDEITTLGPTHVSHLQGGQIHTYELTAADVGVATNDITPLKVSSPQQSADVISSVLGGSDGPPRDIVLLNAAAALVVADLADDIREGMRLAAEAIDSGDAKAVLQKLINVTNR